MQYIYFDSATKEVYQTIPVRAPVPTGQSMWEVDTDLTKTVTTFDPETGTPTDTVQSMPSDLGKLKSMAVETLANRFREATSTFTHQGHVYVSNAESLTYIIGRWAQAKFAKIEADNTWTTNMLDTSGVIVAFTRDEFIVFGDALSVSVESQYSTMISAMAAVKSAMDTDAVYAQV